MGVFWGFSLCLRLSADPYLAKNKTVRKEKRGIRDMEYQLLSLIIRFIHKIKLDKYTKPYLIENVWMFSLP